MVEASNKVIALLDHTKINKNSIATFAKTEEIDMIITNYHASMGFKEKAQKHKIDVILAETNNRQ